MKKAITPVVSVILLIMLVVAITGGAWYWMTNVQGSLQESAGSSIEETSDLATSQFSIVSALCDSTAGTVTVNVINTGSQSIESGTAWLVTLSTTAGSVLGTNTEISGVGDVGSNSAATVTAGGFSMSSGSTYSVRVNVGSSSQSTTCTAQ